MPVSWRAIRASNGTAANRTGANWAVAWRSGNTRLLPRNERGVSREM